MSSFISHSIINHISDEIRLSYI